MKPQTGPESDLLHLSKNRYEQGNKRPRRPPQIPGPEFDLLRPSTNDPQQPSKPRHPVHPDPNHHYHVFRKSSDKTLECNCIDYNARGTPLPRVEPHIISVCKFCPRQECDHERKKIETASLGFVPPPVRTRITPHPSERSIVPPALVSPRSSSSAKSAAPTTPNTPNRESASSHGSWPLHRNQGESPRPSGPPPTPNTPPSSSPTISARCIPEEYVFLNPISAQQLYGYEGLQSCRICSRDFWAWCGTCGNRLCAWCVMKECEREEGRGGIWRVRHWGVQNGGECVSVRKERERLEAYRKEAGGWYSG